MGRKREITGAVTAQTFLFNAALEFDDVGGLVSILEKIFLSIFN